MFYKKETMYDSLYINIATKVATQSYAKKKQVGCVIVKDNHIIAFGWNGTPLGFSAKCENKQGKTKQEVIHAEVNCIAELAKVGVSCNNATMYLTLSPCFDCAKLIVQAGISRVVFLEKYKNSDPISFLKKAKVSVTQLKKQ